MGLSLLDIWNYDAFVLRGLMELRTNDGSPHIDYWEIHVGNQLVAVWTGAAIPQLDLWKPYPRNHRWNIVYLGAFKNVCAVLGMFVWYHRDR